MSAALCVHSIILCKRLLALPPARMESKPLYVGQLSMGWAYLWHIILRSTFVYQTFTLRPLGAQNLYKQKSMGWANI